MNERISSLTKVLNPFNPYENNMRQIVLDTETTGRELEQGHRLIEIGCVEMINRRITPNHYHHYLQPNRHIDSEALAVHGITTEFLKDKPRFADIVNEFMMFIQGAELIIHNAEFDTRFINNELLLLNQGWQSLEHYCQITDTLKLARECHPGQKNSLDALCKRYNIDNSNRQLHGALLDAQLLAEVYLAMTGGQVSLLSLEDNNSFHVETTIKRIASDRKALTIIPPSPEELQAHQQRLLAIDKSSGGKCLWLTLENFTNSTS
jgi:DNA polymerase-3 subunit epsilon